MAALREAADETVRFRRIFAERRRAMVAGLRAIGLGVGFEPEGAFYVLAPTPGASARTPSASRTRSSSMRTWR